MEFRFYRDPDTGLPHCAAHGVTELEVIEVFGNGPLRLRGSEGSYAALGQTDGGRHLKVIYRPDGRDGIFVITAYDLRGKALTAYRRRRRRRGDR